MLRMNSKNKAADVLKKTAAIVVPIIAVILLYVFKGYLVNLLWEVFGMCRVYKYTGLMCPGCGNTRSVTSLMRGDILASLRYNITPFILVVLLLGKYLEWLFSLFGKRIKLLPKNKIFYILIAAFVLTYYIVRNFIPFLKL